MLMLIVRICIGIMIFLFIFMNTIYPAFRKDLPLFWMFRGRKIRDKYKDDLNRIQEQEMEKHIVSEIQERVENLKKGDK